MNTHYHLINCDTLSILKNFIRDGEIGIRMPPFNDNKNPKDQIDSKVRMCWDIFADIARIKKGDYVFLHSEGRIIGLFVVINDPFIVNDFVNIFSNITKEHWKANSQEVIDIIANRNFIVKIPIAKVIDYDFVPMSIIFDYIVKGLITSLPIRLRYEDKNKTIKGIMRKDFAIINNIFKNFFPNAVHVDVDLSRIPHKPTNIKYDIEEDCYEKNLEAFLVNYFRRNDFNVLNTVPVGYLKMVDLLTWLETEDRFIHYVNIWELKSDKTHYKNFNLFKKEMQEIQNRSSFLPQFFNQNLISVTANFVAKRYWDNFDQDTDKLILPIGNINKINFYQIPLNLIKEVM